MSREGPFVVHFDRVEEEAVALLGMEANIMKSRSDLSRQTQKTFSSPRLSSSSVSLSRYLNLSDLHHIDGDDDDGHQLCSHGGTTVSIPFTWESQPGTPKVRFRDHAVPPLTPPPSYFCSPAQATNNSKLRRKTKFLTSILPKLRSSSPTSPTSSSSSSSLWSSVGAAFSSRGWTCWDVHFQTVIAYKSGKMGRGGV